MFEFFFKYPLAAYRKGDWVFASGWPLWLLVLLAALAAGGLAWHAQRSRSHLGQRARAVVWALQALAAALALALLWQPALAVQSLKNRQNAVAVLVDASRSMALGENGVSRLDRVRGALAESVVPALAERFSVRLYSFASAPERLASLRTEDLPSPGSTSAVGESVLQVLRESTALPLGALLVASDGTDNSGRLGRDLLAEIRKYKVPVHTIGIGRERIAGDLELADVTVAAKSMPRSRVSAQLTIRHDGEADRTTRITVRDGTGVLASKPLTLGSGQPVLREWIDFGAGESGVRNLTFAVEPLPGEEIVENNARRRVLDVPRRRRRILYAEGEPRWQYKFMRRAVHKDASVQLVTLLRTSTNKFYRQGVDTPQELEDGFPPESEELFAYDALIVGSFEAAFFTPKQQAAMRDFVSLRGGTLLMLAGPNGLGAGGWQHSELVDVLPVALGPGEDSFVREKAEVELTAQGRESLICRLDPDPARSAEFWAELPPIADYQRLGPLKPGAVALLNVRGGGRDPQPLLVRQNYGRGRAAIFATGGSWTWRMGLPSDDLRHHTFWRQLLRSLVSDTPGPVRLSSDRSNYADEHRVQLRAEVRDRAYELASGAEVSVVVTPESGDPRTVQLAPSPTERGIFEAEVAAEAEGVYRLEATAHLDEVRLGADTLHLRRESGVAEFFHPERTGSVLAQLAEQTGGRYWEVDELGSLPTEIGFSQAGIATREVLDLWDTPALFLLFIALRAAEWLVRKREGVI